MRKTKRPTISDVARLAGVSTATVSRVIQTPDIVTESTRKAVESAIAETGYQVNTAAQMLRRNRATAVLVVVPDIGNTFFSQILAGVEQLASEEGYTIIIGDTGGNADRFSKLMGFLRNGRADGALLLNGEMPTGFDLQGLSVVSVSEDIPGAEIPHVGTDNVGAAREMTEALIALGHKKIAHLSGPESNILSGQRIKGYRDAMVAAGLVEFISVIPASFEHVGGSAAAVKAMSTPVVPTALFCANDECAMGAMAQLSRQGLSVPDDVSVCGFDDIHFSETFIPSISTVRQARFDIGREALRQLLQQLNGQSAMATVTHVPHRIVLRDSTKAL